MCYAKYKLCLPSFAKCIKIISEEYIEHNFSCDHCNICLNNSLKVSDKNGIFPSLRIAIKTNRKHK